MKIKSIKAYPGVLARYAHAKLDGHFTRVLVSNDEIAFYSSLDTRIYVPDRIFDQCESLPQGEYLGELWIPGKPASAVKTALKHEWNDLQLTFFGVAKCEALYNRFMGTPIEEFTLESIHEFFDSHKLNFAPYEVIAQYPVQLSEAELFMYVQRARQAGLEGWVLKTGNLTGWAKLKVDNTIDLVVIGANAGKGKYQGLVGSLICGINGVPIADVGGMDDATREEFTALHREDKLTSTVVEVKYQCVDSKGRLRHPRFVRVRDDKLPHECTIEQDQKLKEYYNGVHNQNNYRR